MAPHDVTFDLDSPEMRAAWREARLLLINAISAGFSLIKVAVDNLAGGADARSTVDIILVGVGCYNIFAGALCGRDLRRIVASVYWHLAASQVFAVAAGAFLCGALAGGAYGLVRAGGLRLAALFGNPVPAQIAFFLLLIAAGWLIAAALVPVLLNRRSLR